MRSEPDSATAPNLLDERRWPADTTDMSDTTDTYRIVRFNRDEFTAETIKRGLTLEQAQQHCQRDDTRGDGWFDGYEIDTSEWDDAEDDDIYRAEARAFIEGDA